MSELKSSNKRGLWRDRVSFSEFKETENAMSKLDEIKQSITNEAYMTILNGICKKRKMEEKKNKSYVLEIETPYICSEKHSVENDYPEHKLFYNIDVGVKNHKITCVLDKKSYDWWESNIGKNVESCDAWTYLKPVDIYNLNLTLRTIHTNNQTVETDCPGDCKSDVEIILNHWVSEFKVLAINPIN